MDVVHVPLFGKHAVGRTCIVDGCDADRVLCHRWWADAERNTAYAVSSIRGHLVRMHRLILGVSREVLVDHRNCDGLDNRRENLRGATHASNAWNTRWVKARSGFRGVYPSGRRWQGAIRFNGVNYYTGTFEDARDAAVARDVLARDLHGEYACTNADLGLL